MTPSFCPACGLQLRQQWGFCPRCGCNIVDQLAPAADASAAIVTAQAPRSAAAIEALALLEAGLADEAEHRLQVGLRESPTDVEGRLLLAGLLMRRYAVQEAGGLYDEAVALAPQEFVVRLRRGEYLARLGRYQDAMADFKAAGRLPAPDFPTLLYCRDVYRWAAERARTTFVRQAATPGIPHWLGRMLRIIPGSTGQRSDTSKGEENASATTVLGHAVAHADAGLPAVRWNALPGPRGEDREPLVP